MSDDMRTRILNLLAREFEYTQALHCEKEEIVRKLALEDIESLDAVLLNLEQDGLVNLWIDHRGVVKLAKITWQGLNQVGEVKLRYGMEGE
ncbi:MAG: hypothetical protein ACFFB7_07790 [Candidatus Sifarchaeia archaeon]